MNSYDSSNPNSIGSHAELLLKKSLRGYYGDRAKEAVRELREKARKLDLDLKNKGELGTLVEYLHFDLIPNSRPEPDFPDACLELKTSPLKKLARETVAKERLVLGIINYLLYADANECEFEGSKFWNKNQHLLLMFYLYQKGVPVIDRVFKLIALWDFPSVDREIIMQDWERIVAKIRAGRAHELSEGDTLYLGAATKGSKGGNPRPQPNNTRLAKQRAFSLKQGYVNHILAMLSESHEERFGRIIKNAAVLKKGRSLEDIVLAKFDRYYGKTDEEIRLAVGIPASRRDSKDFHYALTKGMLGIGTAEEVEEFAKADITVKTSRVDADGMPYESVSFPYFDYGTLILEKWDNSPFREDLEKKFFFVFFKEDEGEFVLRRARFWNMPYRDIQEARKVWRRAIDVVKAGNIVRSVSAKGVRSTNFPKSTENCVAHVRPHAQKASDTCPLPVRDVFTGNAAYTKHSFWLNDKYVKDQIFEK